MTKSICFILLTILLFTSFISSCSNKSNIKEYKNMCITALTPDGNITVNKKDTERFIHGGTIAFKVNSKIYITPIYIEEECNKEKL